MESSLKNSLKNSDKIIDIIRINPSVADEMMSVELMIGVRAVKKQLAALKGTPKIRRVGPGTKAAAGRSSNDE